VKTYTNYYSSDIQRIINNSLTDNIDWAIEVINDSIRYLVTRYYFNERTYTTPTVSGTQFYNLPPQVKKLIDVTVTIGSVVWTPKECPSRQAWDALNAIAFNQDYPSYFFVYNGQVGLFPVPSTSSNTITMNYKTRIEDLAMADVTGTATITTNTTTVTAAAGSPFKAWMAGNWIRVIHSSTDSANGDNQWYQIDSITSSTILVLKNKYTGATVTAGSFTIGQVSILPEDYQDLPLYRMGMIYYSTRLIDKGKYQQYKELYESGLAALDQEFGSKTSSVILNDVDVPNINPNLFQSNIS
jgi:hypothetical protein